MKSISAQCGHIKRRLLRNEPLKGELLDLALSIVGDPERDDLAASMHAHLSAGEPLSEYERHIMVDVLLLHTRLAAATRRREEKEAEAGEP